MSKSHEAEQPSLSRRSSRWGPRLNRAKDHDGVELAHSPSTSKKTMMSQQMQQSQQSSHPPPPPHDCNENVEVEPPCLPSPLTTMTPMIDHAKVSDLMKPLSSPSPLTTMMLSQQREQSPPSSTDHAKDDDDAETLRSPSPLTTILISQQMQQSPPPPIDHAKDDDEKEPRCSPSPLTTMMISQQLGQSLPPPSPTDHAKDDDDMKAPSSPSPLNTMMISLQMDQSLPSPPPIDHAKDDDEMEPLSSPSPLTTMMMSQQMEQSSSPPTNHVKDYGEMEPLSSPSPLTTMRLSSPPSNGITSNGMREHTRTPNMGSIDDDHPPVSLNFDVKDDAPDLEDCAISFDGDELNSKGIDSVAEKSPAMNHESSERLLVHKMKMKKRAIFRSLLHLSDNSYSFVYNESAEGCCKTKGMSDDDEPGLPYIGPDLKEQYELLRTLLQKGLLGSSDDVVLDYSHDGTDDAGTKSKTESLEDSTVEVNGQYALSDHGNPFIPKIKSNVSAILMGPRGHGKSLVLERCLASLARLAGKRKERLLEKMTQERHLDQTEDIPSQASFRVVRLNGLLFQGDSAVACTQEIARQIGVMSREERRRTRKIIEQIGVRRKRSNAESLVDPRTPKSFKRLKRKGESATKRTDQIFPSMAISPATPLLSDDLTQTLVNNGESHDLRIRRSGFNTYIALLDEALRTARIDGIPILIVFEELGTFLAGGRSSKTESSEGGNLQHDGGSSDRQLLLYHLLDRVADHKFLVSFVGITTDLTAVSKLEKRVQSRAEGSSKIIYFGHNHEYEDLVKSLLGKFYTPPGTGDSTGDEYDEHMAMLDIREEVEVILRGSKSERDVCPDEDDEDTNDFELVRRVLQRNYNIFGSDMRWVCRVFDVALGLFASDIDEFMYQRMDTQNNTGYDRIPKLAPSHIAQALVATGASLDDISGKLDRTGIPTQSTMELIRWGQLIRDPDHYSCLLGTNTRLITLLDLSGPQVAVLLAARRIEARDDARTNVEDEIENNRSKGKTGDGTTSSTPLPLTYQRIQDEYTTSFVASRRYTISSDRYPQNVLYRSCMDLMEVDLIRLKREICGGGAFQYEYNDRLSSGANILNLPLHVNLDWELEFMGALKSGLLHCSTALREWGMKIN